MGPPKLFEVGPQYFLSREDAKIYARNLAEEHHEPAIYVHDCSPDNESEFGKLISTIGS